MQTIVEQLLETDWVPILLALVVGGAIGLEREIHGRPAGLRTHMLVCLSATMLVYTSRQFAPVLEHGSVVFDPQRLSAGIVTGIGFLGAAAVVRSGDIVRGITTGACVWSVAGLGVVIGQGAYGIAIAAACAILVVLIFLDWTTGGISSLIYRQMRISGTTDRLAELIEDVRALLKQHKVRVQELSGSLVKAAGPYHVVFHVRCRNSVRTVKLIESVAAHAGVDQVEWLIPGPRD